MLASAGDRRIEQFVHKAWTAKDGAPASIVALAQTKDGFLWAGSRTGLYRFDGMSFEHYEPTAGPPFPSRGVRALSALPNGDLWIGFYDEGASVLRFGRNTNYTAAQGLPPGSVKGFAQDREGTIWVAASSGVARLERERWVGLGVDNFGGKLLYSVYMDRHGILWCGTETAVAFLSPGSKQFAIADTIRQGSDFRESPNGTLWVAETGRSVHPVPAAGGEPGNETEIKVGSAAILFARDGSLWITTLGDGLRRAPLPDQWNGQKIGQFSDLIESFTTKDGLSSDYSMSILEDREGDIWVGTGAGLDRFSRSALTPIRLPGKFTDKLLTAGEGGDIFVATNSPGVARIQGNTWKIELAAHWTSSARGAAGNTWWQSEGYELFRLQNGRFRQVVWADPDKLAMATLLASDHSGLPWLATDSGTFYFLEGVRWKLHATSPELAGRTPSSTFTDSMDRIWFGYPNNVLAVTDRQGVRVLSAKDGIAIGSVKAIHGRERHLWIGGTDGVELFDGNAFRNVAPADGQKFGNVSGMVETAPGALWLNEYRGVVYIPENEVSKVLKDPSYHVRYQVFDTSDGIPGAVQQGQPFPTAIEGGDGRLWFASSDGVAWIDPAHIPKNPVPPPVSIRSIQANGSQYRSLERLRLPALTRDLRIDYTALSLSIPERVRFRYKLEGSDREWQEAGSRRQAFYTNLGPGPYRFRVLACNSDGVWNEAGSVLDFSIAPAFYQTIWFQGLGWASGAGILWLLYILRLKQATAHMNAQLNARVEERTRMARELHDTLLQTIQVSKMVAEHAWVGFRDDTADPRTSALEKLSAWLAKALEEARASLASLRSSALESNNLAEAFRQAGAQCVLDYPIQFSFTLEGTLKDMHPIARDEVYRIGYEAIRNACNHSGGSRVEVHLEYANDLRLRVRDDGKGMDPEVAAKGRPGHFGLKGMQERAARIGGKLNLVSSPGEGTMVELIVPGRAAFSVPDPFWRTLFTKRPNFLD